MSEYQYYEFRTVNRQLTTAQRTAVDRLSSHGHTTATSFSVNYSYGDFKHKPEEVLTRYFDAFFYISNWGTVQLMFRYPKELIDTRAIEPYCNEGPLTLDCRTVGESVILDFELNQEDGGDWVEGEGALDGVLGLYHEILQRDYRALYLAWLRSIQDGGDDNEYDDEDNDEERHEPPVPLGLATLSPSLTAFAELFGVDDDLIAAAAQSQAQSPTTVQVDQAAALAALSKEESIDFLQRLLQGEAYLEVKLKQRLGLLPPNVGNDPTGQRTVTELLAARHAIEEAHKKAAAEARAAQRRVEMAALATQGERAWYNVEAFIEQKTSKGYEQAVELLLQLHELAREQKQERTFASRVDEIRNRYSRRSGLMRELRRIQV